MPTTAVITLAIAFTISALACRIVRKMARSSGVVDLPGGHKQHDRPVALGGGIAITWTICIPVLILVALSRALDVDHPPAWLPAFLAQHLGGIAFKSADALAIVGCTIALHLVGLLDDRRPMGPAPKLVVQSAAAFVIAAIFDIRLLELESLPPVVSICLTMLWIVLITNAFNFLDNMDGLSAGVASIAGLIFALSAFGAGQIFVPSFMLLLVGALLGFLVYNFPPASLFMGDAGSLPVGFLMSVLIILTTFYDPTKQLQPAGVFLPVVVLAVPLYDVASVVVHRIRAGDSIFKGDRRHFSHRLLKRGMSVPTAALTIYLATAATGLGAILLPHVGWFGASLIFSQCLCVVLIIALLEHAE
jgi:UDP-GlcNAc:undecaprenyl-phosphate/decaprenyl-phosphate GlcNAc-1-phosphate transferase